MKKLILLSVSAVALLSFFALKSSSQNEATIPSGVGQWASFGTYKKGDSIIYWGGKWKPGTIMEVGKPYNPGAKNAETGETKYEVMEGGGLNWPDWKDFSQVAGKQREDWWTGFFTGDWKLGEMMAVNTRREGAYERNEYSYLAAQEALRVLPNGTYSWRTSDRKTITGKWIPLTDGPGIVLQKGYKGMNWTFINQSNAITMHIRKLENGRLLPDGPEVSKAATRPMK